MIPGLRKYKMNMEHLVPESKEVSKDDRNMSKEQRRQFKGVLFGQVCDNLSIKINSSNGL